MEKPKVFISHITEEKQLADVIKTRIQGDFLGMLDVFVSSDQISIAVGNKWLNDVDDALKSAQVELILCSKDSVSRPWINFEAGAGWVKGIPVVPVCHTGMRPVDLPIPLNMLQAVEASSPMGWDRIYRLLATKLGSAVPAADFADLVDRVKAFEHEYGLVREISAAVHVLTKLLPDLDQIFRPSPAHSAAAGDVSDIVLDKMRPHLDLLQSRGMISYATGSNKIVFGASGGGNMVELKLEVLPAYTALAAKVMAR